jgi:hypothetical protein
MFNLSQSVFLSGEAISVVVTGMYFYPPQYNAVTSRPVCVLFSYSLNATERLATVAKPALFKDTCHVLCEFSAEEYSPLLVYAASMPNTTGSIYGVLSIAAGEQTFAPTCSELRRSGQSQMFRTNPCAAYQDPLDVSPWFGCDIRVIGHPDPARFVYEPPGASVTVLSEPLYFLKENISVYVCDASGNAVTSNITNFDPVAFTPRSGQHVEIKENHMLFSNLSLVRPVLNP